MKKNLYCFLPFFLFYALFTPLAADLFDQPDQAETYYYAGVDYYRLSEYELANEAFNRYLTDKNSPQFFQEVMLYKFSIAEQFRCGAKRRILGKKSLPKWLSAHEEALEIYDEVVAALPNNDLAAKALFYKGCLLWKMRDFRSAIDSYQLLIRRFPKQELTPQAYLNITKIYLDQSKDEFQNPDLISLAEVNVKKFENDYPRDERVTEAHTEVHRIKEVYARGLFDTAQFYERKSNKKAAMIYYENAIRKFPQASIIRCCKTRLRYICPALLADMEAAQQNSQEAQTVDGKIDEQIDIPANPLYDLG